MTYLTALLLIALTFGAVALLTTLIALWLPLRARRRYHEIGIAVFLQLGVVFAVLLAFVFNEVWEQFNAAQDAVNKECVDLEGAANRAAYLAPDAARGVRDAIGAYIGTEIDEEWPDMERRRSSPATTLAYARLFARVATVPPTTPLVAASRENILRMLADVHDERQLRLFQLDSNVPAFLWGLLGAFACVLTLLVMLSAVGHNSVQSVLAGTFAAFLVAILLTIHLLDYPFEGSIRVTTKPLHAALRALEAVPADPGEGG